jgi:hypothetical protein
MASDISGDRGLRVMTAHELGGPAGQVIFVDDFIGSGRQAVSMLEAWLDREPSFELGEDRAGAALSDRARQALVEAANCAFVFTAGLDEGVELLRSKLDEWGLTGIVNRGISKQELPTIETARSAGDIDGEFVEELRRIGAGILTSRGVDSGVANGRALGYGNLGLLLAFPFNVPSQTVTALWDSGVVDGTEWSPLLPRRRKT